MEIQAVRKISYSTLLMLPLMTLAGCNSSSDTATSVTPQSKTVFSVIGDTPYGTSPTDFAQLKANPNFISAINQESGLTFVAHVGDIHAGKQYCTQDYDVTILNQWSGFKIPLIYTPGDNEWADCHKAKEGGGKYNATTGAVDYVVDSSGNLIDYTGGDPVANLELIRSLYFSNPGKAFGGALAVHSQALEFDKANPTDNAFVENVWRMDPAGVLFVTVNIPGGSNNGTDPWYGAPSMSPAQTQIVNNRTAAVLRWLDTAFAQAKSNNAKSVVIFTQADMWDNDGATPEHITQYKQYIDKMAANALSFGKPVLLFLGDSHIYRSDNPLVKGAPCFIEPAPGTTAVACTDGSAANSLVKYNNPTDPYLNQPNGYNVPNFHRVVVHGETVPVEYLKVNFDSSVNLPATASSFGPFSWVRINPKVN